MNTKENEMREETLQIIKENNLSLLFIANLAGYKINIGYRYLKKISLEKQRIDDIERGVIEWYSQLVRNRRRLLLGTKYEGIY